MRTRPFAVVAVVLGVVAQAAVAQQREGAPDAGAPASAPPPPLGSVASLVPPAPADPPSAPAAEPPPAPAPEAPLANSVARRDACAEVLRAVQFEDEPGAVAAYARCRDLVAHEGRVPGADEVRTLEDVTEALHALRREDGAFCVEPSAPFDFHALLGEAADTRACLLALDRLLGSDNAIWRFVLADEYASGRLAARGGYDVTAARRSRVRPPPDSPAERELVAIARLVGRHFMRTCRCLQGPQPDTVTAVRAMELPSTVERVILGALEEREGAHAEP
ncbi:MAG: hypothetical protein U0324_40835 [Polyangiales bacterium]